MLQDKEKKSRGKNGALFYSGYDKMVESGFLWNHLRPRILGKPGFAFRSRFLTANHALQVRFDFTSR
jgi:hypothetical protein